MHPRDDVRERAIHLDRFVVASRASLPGSFEQGASALRAFARVEGDCAQRRAADIRRQIRARRIVDHCLRQSSCEIEPQFCWLRLALEQRARFFDPTQA
ncbi:MAG: hypothetical protein WDO74_30490 [Pseudomonadota bacterium]